MKLIDKRIFFIILPFFMNRNALQGLAGAVKKTSVFVGLITNFVPSFFIVATTIDDFWCLSPGHCQQWPYDTARRAFFRAQNAL
ncbi:hypothetical protein AZI86_12290 [Bdellovibrio bacteriovorus]|uniref:Uncharacterized protein n=1 Tax=Bdellovibrio bacteriovorus TaxID=959 RepID=A0A150WMD8_BDEBC|nr:hypothetical protein AZI86_12290 [Bdellovibrio bacteriovorus]